MADISIQFHALPEELLPFVAAFVGEFRLHVVAMRFFPFEAKEISAQRLPHVFSDESPYSRIAFTIEQPNIAVRNELEFGSMNPDHLRLDIGRKKRQGLEQAWLSARTDNARALSSWRLIAKKLKAVTHKGVTAVDPKTGATAEMRSYRFTSGAKKLEIAGIAMLPPAGTSLLRLGEVEPCQE